MKKTDEMKKLEKMVGLIFDNNGDITNTEKYRKNFLNHIIDQITDKLKIADYLYFSGKGKYDVIEVFFKIKSKNWPRWSSKEYVEKERKMDHDTFPEANLLDWLSTELEEALDADKVTVWIDVRSGDKKKRDAKVAIYHKRKVEKVEDIKNESDLKESSDTATVKIKPELDSECFLEKTKETIILNPDGLQEAAKELNVPIITSAQKNDEIDDKKIIDCFINMLHTNLKDINNAICVNIELKIKIMDAASRHKFATSHEFRKEFFKQLSNDNIIYTDSTFEGLVRISEMIGGEC